jgi:hypothetical protein
MRRLGNVLAAAALAWPAAGLAVAPDAAAAPDTAGLLLADFDGRAAAFPEGWRARDDATARRVYRVAREGEARYLRAVARGESAQIGLPVSFALREYPRLAWRWRVHELPASADERVKAANDSAAGVYVVFRGGFAGLVPRAIKYVWSARHPRGAAFPSPGYANARIVVLESGAEGLGAWRTERVHVAADYRRLFGGEPPEVRGIALLTDADDTGSRAAADYGDFRALPPEAGGDGAPETLRLAR